MKHHHHQHVIKIQSERNIYLLILEEKYSFYGNVITIIAEMNI